jgi:hypothetical protein
MLVPVLEITPKPFSVRRSKFSYVSEGHDSYVYTWDGAGVGDEKSKEAVNPASRVKLVAESIDLT